MTLLQTEREIEEIDNPQPFYNHPKKINQLDYFISADSITILANKYYQPDVRDFRELKILSSVPFVKFISVVELESL